MSLAYKIALLAKQLCCYRANPLQFFDESAGATLTKKGGGASLVLADTSTLLGDAGTNTSSGLWSAVGGGADNVASGEKAVVAGGNDNQASGEQSFVGGGQMNEASGDQSAVLGGGSNLASGENSAVLGGLENVAAGDLSVAIGGGANARHYGEFAQSNGGIAQRGNMVAYVQTADATPVQATLNGSAFIVPTDNEVWGFRARISARCTAASKAWVTDLEFAVTNFGGTLAQLGTTDTGFDKKTGSTTWTAAVYVSGNDVSVTVTGAGGETVDWGVDFWYSKIGF